MAVSFIGGGNWSARRKPQAGHKSLGMKNNNLFKWPSNAVESGIKHHKSNQTKPKK
jgi:hypothetical protein